MMMMMMMCVPCPVGHVFTESCMMETFNASCPLTPLSVLLLHSALYGRMRIGRCVTSGFGYIGCKTDVRQYLDSKCSGRRECQIALPDPILFKRQPCPPDLTAYLEVTYACVPGKALLINNRFLLTR